MLLILVAAMLALCACGSQAGTGRVGPEAGAISDADEDETPAVSVSDADEDETSAVSLADIPAYCGEPWVIIHGNLPFFTEDDKTTEAFEEYSELDALGRCGTAFANVCRELMPTEERGDISEIHPTGWHSSFYDFVEGEALYNRCHLIAHELTGEDANERNLITGTSYFNREGMNSFEDLTADYIYETGNHVLYRVTPMFEGDDLVARGVLMEAYSVEDDGEGICFCVYCYNVEPGVAIDYATGDNWLDVGDDYTYILNTNTMKFHLSDCPGVDDIADYNKSEYTGSRDELIAQGYSACGTCNP